MFTKEAHNEVVALEVNGDILFGDYAVSKALASRTVSRMFTREVFEFMAEMDLDPKWAEYALYPTIFLMSDYNNFIKTEK